MTKPNDSITPILEFDELTEVFGYKNERAARRALRLDKFPVPTFELAGRTVAHVDVVNEFFKRMYGEGVEILRSRGVLPDEQANG